MRSYALVAIAASVVAILVGALSPALGQEPTIGGPFVKFNDQDWTPQHPPLRMSGQVLVPIRDFAATVGASVTWDAATKMVKLARDNTYIQLWVGRTMAVINNTPEALSIPPLLVDNTLYAPLEPLAKTFGGQVKWDPDTETAIVSLGGTTYQEVVGTLLQVYSGPPPALLIFEKDTARYRAIALSDTTEVLAGPSGQRPNAVKLADLRAGDLVHLFIDDQGHVVRVVAEFTQVQGTVQNVEGQNILVEGGRIIKLLDTANIVDPGGKPVSPDAIAPGAQIRARVNPATMETAEVVVVRAAAATKPRIRALGIVDPKPAYRSGSTIRVRLIGTPSGSATVAIPGVVPETKMREVKPGYYEATIALNLPRGQEKQVRIQAKLLVRGTLLTKATDPFWIDGKPPVFLEPRPKPDTVVDRLRPTISVAFRDEGSGVDLDSVRLWLDKKEVTRHLTFTSRRCTYEPDEDLSLGVHNVHVRASDKAGHTAGLDWSFRVQPAAGQKILAVKHNADGILGEGETLRINVVTTEEGRRCWVTVGPLTINLNKKRTTKRGHIVYAAAREVQRNDRIENGQLTAYFIDRSGHQYTMKAELPVTLRGDLPAGVRISGPKTTDKIKGAFRVQGWAKPGSTIRVTVTYYKKAFIVFQGKLAQVTVKADDNGFWQTEPIDPKVPLIGTPDSYTITAELIVGDKIKARDQRVVEAE